MHKRDVMGGLAKGLTVIETFTLERAPDDRGNVVFVGPNGTGKTTLAQNIPHQALIVGHTVLFTSGCHLFGDLAALDSDSALRRRHDHYARPQLLAIDEVGYLSYSNRHADLMFELISRAHRAARPPAPQCQVMSPPPKPPL